MLRSRVEQLPASHRLRPRPPARLRRRPRPARVAVTLLLATMLAAGCATGQARGDDEGELGGSITVFAAASLTDVFTQIGAEFEAEYPGTTVVFNFAGSSTLAQQINEGAPVDVFAAADPVAMQTVADAGVTEVDPVVFARNQLVIAVEPGNPLGLTGLADLTRADVTLALCAEQVPCGRASAAVLAAGGVTVEPVTFEQDVRAALTRVALGEVDAALVYRTDVSASSDVDGVEFPESSAATNDYPITVLGDAPNPALAEAFVAYVRSATGAAALQAAGFQGP